MSRALADAFMGAMGFRVAGVEVVLPLRTVNPLNGSHQHWSRVAARRKQERRVAAMAVPACPLPCVVTLTRLSAGTLDCDNLRASMKAIRDGIADRLGVPDNDPRVKWEYGQEKTARGVYGVRVTITEGTP